MRIRANIWHLIGRLYQPAVWQFFTTKSVQAHPAKVQIEGAVLFKLNWTVQNSFNCDYLIINCDAMDF